jgi:hypothetical protein
VTLPPAYFNWLYDQLYSVREMESWRSYTTVCTVMHQIEFKDLVPHDSNRIADAAELRAKFRDETPGRFEALELTNLMFPNATVFEVLFALADRADFMIPLTRPTWFRIFLENLKLAKYSDDYSLTHSAWPIHRIINRFNDRQYKRDGRGGIFPLRDPEADQRDVELWYQMGAYMTENRMY